MYKRQNTSYLHPSTSSLRGQENPVSCHKVRFGFVYAFLCASMYAVVG